MALTPEKIRSQTFPIVRRGYDKELVTEFLDRIAETVEAGGGARSSAEHSYADVGDQVSHILQAAEASAAAKIAEAEQHAAHVRSQIDTASERIAAEAEAEAEHTRQSASADADQMREAARVEAEAIVDEARRQAADIVEQARSEGSAAAAQMSAAANHEADEIRRRAEVEAREIRQRSEASVAEYRQAAEVEAAALRESAEADAIETRRNAEVESAARASQFEAERAEAQRLLDEADRRLEDARSAEARLADHPPAAPLGPPTPSTPVTAPAHPDAEPPRPEPTIDQWATSPGQPVTETSDWSPLPSLSADHADAAASFPTSRPNEPTSAAIRPDPGAVPSASGRAGAPLGQHFDREALPTSEPLGGESRLGVPSVDRYPATPSQPPGFDEPALPDPGLQRPAIAADPTSFDRTGTGQYPVVESDPLGTAPPSVGDFPAAGADATRGLIDQEPTASYPAVEASDPGVPLGSPIDEWSRGPADTSFDSQGGSTPLASSSDMFTAADATSTGQIPSVEFGAEAAGPASPAPSVNLWADELPDAQLPSPSDTPAVRSEFGGPPQPMGPAAESEDPLAAKIAELTRSAPIAAPPAGASDPMAMPDRTPDASAPGAPESSEDPLEDVVRQAVGLAVARSRRH